VQRLKPDRWLRGAWAASWAIGSGRRICINFDSHPDRRGPKTPASSQKISETVTRSVPKTCAARTRATHSCVPLRIVSRRLPELASSRPPKLRSQPSRDQGAVLPPCPQFVLFRNPTHRQTPPDRLSVAAYFRVTHCELTVHLFCRRHGVAAKQPFSPRPRVPLDSPGPEEPPGVTPCSIQPRRWRRWPATVVLCGLCPLCALKCLWFSLCLRVSVVNPYSHPVPSSPADGRAVC